MKEELLTTKLFPFQRKLSAYLWYLVRPFEITCVRPKISCFHIMYNAVTIFMLQNVLILCLFEKVFGLE